ncbi:MAG: DMT family transporter [Clostridia bacterium]|nr:DMT family transporter [Clostridia bacterium]
MMNKTYSAYIELTIGTILAGSSVVVGKIITTSLPVSLSQCICLVAALAVLLPVCCISGGGFPRVQRKDIPFIFLQALFGMFLFRVLMLEGLKHASAVDSGIITSSTPAVVSILAFIFLKESLTSHKIFGILCTVSGIAVINLMNISNSSGVPSSSFWGILLVLCAVVCEALLTIFRKVSPNEVPPIVGTFYVTLFTFLLFVPNAALEASKLDFSLITFPQWMILLYYGIVVTALAYILWFRGISIVPASTAAAYTGFIPISTLILSVVILQERITLLHILGIALALFGIVLISVFEKPGKTGIAMDNA